MRSIALALALSASLFAHSQRAHARGADKRGSVEVRGRSVKAVTTGPALVHGYSAYSGGALFVAPVIAGTDADCAAALATRADLRPTTLVADRMAYVPVGAGQIACLETVTTRSFELLWHAFATETSETYLASAKAR